MGSLLSEIEVPDLGSVHLDLAESAPKEKEDIFAEKKRKGWDKSVEARCDFTPKPRLTRRSGLFFLSYWQKSIYGRTLTEIKADDAMVPFFAETISHLISEILGDHLQSGGYCIITTPKRRHKVLNFATRISISIAEKLGIPFYEDVCSCRGYDVWCVIRRYVPNLQPLDHAHPGRCDKEEPDQAEAVLYRAFDPGYNHASVASPDPSADRFTGVCSDRRRAEHV